MILEKILSIFLIMAIGFTAKKVKAVDATFLRGLSGFMINIALPFAFLGSLDRSIPRSVLPELGMMALWAAAIHAVEILIALFAYRRVPEGKRRILMFITVFANSAFMGLPVAQSVAGRQGVMFASIYNIFYGLLIYTWGISLFRRESGGARLKRALLNPGIIATCLGLLLWIAPFSLPAFALDTIDIMARLQTPIAMFIVGANIANVRLKGLFSGGPELAAAVFVRIVALPLLVYAVIRLTGATGTAPSISLLMVAMPAAAQTVVVAEKEGGDSTFASEAVLATTLLSLLSIPLFASLAV